MPKIVIRMLVLISATLLILIAVSHFSSVSSAPSIKKRKAVMSVTEAIAYSTEIDKDARQITVKGIFTGQTNNAETQWIYIEDMKESNKDKLTCIFSKEAAVSLSSVLKKTEVIITGKPKNENATFFLTDCQLIGINEATVKETKFPY
jgi:hypothetical protein